MITNIKHIFNHKRPIASFIAFFKELMLDLIISSAILYIAFNTLTANLKMDIEINYANTFLICLICRILFYNWTSLAIEKHLFENKILYINEINKKIIQDNMIMSMPQGKPEIDDDKN